MASWSVIGESILGRGALVVEDVIHNWWLFGVIGAGVGLTWMALLVALKVLAVVIFFAEPLRRLLMRCFYLWYRRHICLLERAARDPNYDVSVTYRALMSVTEHPANMPVGNAAVAAHLGFTPEMATINDLAIGSHARHVRPVPAVMTLAVRPIEADALVDWGVEHFVPTAGAGRHLVSDPAITCLPVFWYELFMRNLATPLGQICRASPTEVELAAMVRQITTECVDLGVRPSHINTWLPLVMTRINGERYISCDLWTLMVKRIP